MVNLQSEMIAWLDGEPIAAAVFALPRAIALIGQEWLGLKLAACPIDAEQIAAEPIGRKTRPDGARFESQVEFHRLFDFLEVRIIGRGVTHRVITS
jgi:hypothetical protein